MPRLLLRHTGNGPAPIRNLFDKRPSDVARAAIFGAIDRLLLDIGSVVDGFVDDHGGARAFASGSDVQGLDAPILAARQELAAILRYSL